MKKFLSILASICLFAICLTGCNKTSYANSPYVGTWHATTIESEELGIQLLAEDFFDNFDLTLDASGNATLNIDGEETTGSWKETDTGFSVQKKLNFVVEDNVATLEYENVIVHCEK